MTKKISTKPKNTKIQEAGGPLVRDNADRKDYSEESQDETAKKTIEEDGEAEVDMEVEENLDEVEDEDALGNNAEIEDEDVVEGDEVEEENVEEVEVEADQYEEPGDETCLYNFKKKKTFDESDDEIDDEEEIFEDDEKQINEIVTQELRETKQVLFKHERVRILGDRAKQLSLGAKPMVKNVENFTPKEIAKEELKHGVIPFIIERTLPDGRRERWKVAELELRN